MLSMIRFPLPYRFKCFEVLFIVGTLVVHFMVVVHNNLSRFTVSLLVFWILEEVGVWRSTTSYSITFT